MTATPAPASRPSPWPCWEASPWLTIRSWHYLNTYTLPRIVSLLGLSLLPLLGAIHHQPWLFWLGTVVVFGTDYVMFGRIADERRGAHSASTKWRDEWRLVEKHAVNVDGGKRLELPSDLDPLQALPACPYLWLPTQDLPLEKPKAHHVKMGGDQAVGFFSDDALERLRQAAARRFLASLRFPSRTLFRIQADDGKPSIGMLIRVSPELVTCSVVSFYPSHGQLMANAWTRYYSDIAKMAPGASTSGRSYLGDRWLAPLRRLVEATQQPLLDWVIVALALLFLVGLVFLDTWLLWFPALLAVSKFTFPAFAEALTGNRLGVFRRHHHPKAGESADYHILEEDRKEHHRVFRGVPTGQSLAEAHAIAEAVDALAFEALNPN